MGRKTHWWVGGAVLLVIVCVCFSLAHVCRFRLRYLLCRLVSWVAYTCLLRIYAFTVVIKTCLPPADRHIASALWRPKINPLVSLSSHPSFKLAVSLASYFRSQNHAVERPTFPSPLSTPAPSPTLSPFFFRAFPSPTFSFFAGFRRLLLTQIQPGGLWKISSSDKPTADPETRWQHLNV